MKPTVKHELVVTSQKKEHRIIYMDVWTDAARSEVEEFGNVIWLSDRHTALLIVYANYDFDEVLLYFLNYDKPVTT